MRIVSALACTVTLSFAAPAFAQDVERYQLERTADGYVRLDTVTGKVSLCEERAGRLVCKMAVEERTAYENEIDDLAARIEKLEGRVSAIEGGRPAAGLPTDEEFEQTMGYMEQFFRRFMGIVKDLEKDSGQPRPEADRS